MLLRSTHDKYLQRDYNAITGEQGRVSLTICQGVIPVCFNCFSIPKCTKYLFGAFISSIFRTFILFLAIFRSDKVFGLDILLTLWYYKYDP